MLQLPWESLPTLVLKAQEEKVKLLYPLVYTSLTVRAAINLAGMAVELAISIDFSQQGMRLLL